MHHHENRRLEVAAAFVKDPRPALSRLHDMLLRVDDALERLPAQHSDFGFTDLAGHAVARKCLGIAANRIAEEWHGLRPHPVSVAPRVAAASLMPDVLGRLQRKICADVAAGLRIQRPSKSECEHGREFAQYAGRCLAAWRHLPGGMWKYDADPIFEFAERVLVDLAEILADAATSAAKDARKPWADAATVSWLNMHPLPATFRWSVNGQLVPVRPVHVLMAGFGTWLRETPYFPGLYEACHGVLAACEGRDIEDGAGLAARLQAKTGQEEAA